MLFRLRDYGTQIMGRFVSLMDTLSPTEEQAALIKRFEADIERLATVIMFFNQPLEDCSLEEWIEQTPQIYREKLLRSLSLLQECLFWTKMAILHGEDRVIGLDYLETLRVDPLESSALHSSFVLTCRQLHRLIPQNLYLKFALVRLIRSYCEAKEAIAMAQDLTSCDRLAYLKRISRPI